MAAIVFGALLGKICLKSALKAGKNYTYSESTPGSLWQAINPSSKNSHTIRFMPVAYQIFTGRDGMINKRFPTSRPNFARQWVRRRRRFGPLVRCGKVTHPLH
jgi:hypothetical protein